MTGERRRVFWSMPNAPDSWDVDTMEASWAQFFRTDAELEAMQAAAMENARRMARAEVQRERWVVSAKWMGNGAAVGEERRIWFFPPADYTDGWVVDFTKEILPEMLRFIEDGSKLEDVVYVVERHPMRQAPRDEQVRVTVFLPEAPFEVPLENIGYHSPTGFEMGYSGSGPADTALSILCHFLDLSPVVAHGIFRGGMAGATKEEMRDARTAWQHHQRLKEEKIALDRDHVRVTGEELLRLLATGSTLDVAGQPALPVGGA